MLPLLLQKYKEYEKDVAIEEIDGLQLVKKLAKNMEEMFHKKSEAVRVSLPGSALSCPKTTDSQPLGTVTDEPKLAKFVHCVDALICSRFFILATTKSSSALHPSHVGL